MGRNLGGAPLGCRGYGCGGRTPFAGRGLGGVACKGVEMNGLLAMLLYLNHKCDTDDRFRKTFLVLTLIFVFMFWSPWTRWNCPVFGLCPGPSSAVSKNSAAQSSLNSRRLKRQIRLGPTPPSVKIPAERFAQVAVQR